MVPAPQTTAQGYNSARYDPRPEGPRCRAKSAPNNRSGGLRSRNLSFRDKRRRFPLPEQGEKALQNLLSGFFLKVIFSTYDPTLTIGGQKYDFQKTPERRFCSAFLPHCGSGNRLLLSWKLKSRLLSPAERLFGALLAPQRGLPGRRSYRAGL